MRVLPFLLSLAALAAAKEYRFEDPLFGVAYAAPGLEKGLPPSDPALLFRGRCAGGVDVEIRVHETAEVLDAAAWMKRIRKGKPEDAREEGARLTYTRKRLGVFEERHGHALHPRGHHCFELHAWGEDAAAVERALAGLAVGEDEGCGVLARRFALQKGKSPLEAELLLEAGVEYVQGRRFGQRNLGVARGLLARARRTAQPDDLTPEQRWTLLETGGLAHAELPELAIEWHRLAEEAAKKLEERSEERAAQSAYNLACVCSRAKRIDEAFAALHRAYAGAKPVTDAHLSNDRDLENLRRDDRWHAFWKERVAGR